MQLWKYVSWRPLEVECKHDTNCKLVSKCYSQDNILNSQLYFNSAKAFNDPFDIAPFFDTVATPEQILESAVSIVNFKEGLVGNVALHKAKKLIKNAKMNTRAGRQRAQKGQLASLQQIGVCCFSKAGPENILMWSHYAQKHTGICLEFNLPSRDEFLVPLENSKKHPIISPMAVKYHSNLPQANLFNHTVDEIRDCLITKSIEWGYEVEYRALCRNYIGLISYQPWTLNAITAGCCMQDKEFEELVTTVNKLRYQPRLYRAVKKEREYGIELNRII